MNIRNKKLGITWLSIIILLIPNFIKAQGDSTREIIQRAMRDEMTRNIRNLKLENLKRPFYISYTIRDVKTMTVTATLGGVVQSSENHYRNHSVRVMVGDYSRTDENFLDFSGGGYRSTMLQNADRLPIEDDYHSIRRALWIATDNVYKSASEKYERKKAALEQQNISEEAETLDDFTKAPALKFEEPPRLINMDRIQWEKNAKDLSAIFRNYPDIYTSQVRIFFYQADVYFTNSEGIETVQPLTLTAVQINGSTQAVDGEPLSNHVIYYGQVPQDLPSIKSITNSVKTMAEELIDLRTAPVFDDSYIGPVLLEEQVVAEFFAQRLFIGSNGLLAHRKPALGDARTANYFSQTMTETLEERINRRILSRDITIKALPTTESFSGQKLIGNFKLDAEGIKPPAEIVLVEKGILKQLLGNRTPTPKMKESNGHQRPIIGTGRMVSSCLGPSVISVTTSKGKSEKDMKKALLKRAREEKLDYAILVRKLKSPVTGIDRRMDPMSWLTLGGGAQRSTSLSEPLLVYRVFVEDGREELVRSVKLGDVTLSTMRHILGSGRKRFVYNTLVPAVNDDEVWYAYARRVSSQGVPSSFIVPRLLLLEELEVESQQRDFTPKLPVVPSPLLQE